MTESNAKTTAGLASHTESDTPTVAQAREFVRKQVTSRTDPDNGLTAPELRDRMKAHYGKSVKATTIRDIIQQLKHDDHIPIANFGNGYFQIVEHDHFVRAMEDKARQRRTLKENMESLAQAYNQERYSESESE